MVWLPEVPKEARSSLTPKQVREIHENSLSCGLFWQWRGWTGAGVRRRRAIKHVRAAAARGEPLRWALRPDHSLSQPMAADLPLAHSRHC